ncbi:MAG: signal peptidase I [Spirochaetia bacterium]|nr:signal peptidase I [Spirochaetia bacterium]
MLKLYYRFHEGIKKIFNKYPKEAPWISLGGIIIWVLIFKSVVLSANNIPTGSMIPTLKIGDFLFVNRMRYGVHLPFTDINLFQVDKPTRGDVVVFTPPPSAGLDGKTLVKRLIGMPGDEIVVRDNEIYVNDVHYPVRNEDDREILNDLDYPHSQRDFTENDLLLFREKVMEPKTGKVMVDHYMMKNGYYKKLYLQDLLNNSLSNPKEIFVIPPGKYMFMGDNRDDSDDSRHWGYVDENQIHGKVFMIYFSVNWGKRFLESRDDENPFMNLFRLVGGQLKHVSVRWNRIGNRIY